MEVLKKIIVKIRYGMVMHSILNQFVKIGFRIEPFLLYQEGIFTNYPEGWEDSFTDYEVEFLGSEDMKVIGAIPGRAYFNEERLLARLEEGKKCLGLRCNGDIAAFTWCDFENCHDKLYEFPLKKDEVYLFDAYTLEAFRGEKIAPYLRFKCYQELQNLDYSKFYSYSLLFNKPAIRFKKKLNARPLLLGLKVTIRKKGSWSWIIKKM
jgi:hypothetical protein